MESHTLSRALRKLCQQPLFQGSCHCLLMSGLQVIHAKYGMMIWRAHCSCTATAGRSGTTGPSEEPDMWVGKSVWLFSLCVVNRSSWDLAIRWWFMPPTIRMFLLVYCRNSPWRLFCRNSMIFAPCHGTCNNKSLKNTWAPHDMEFRVSFGNRLHHQKWHWFCFFSVSSRETSDLSAGSVEPLNLDKSQQ